MIGGQLFGLPILRVQDVFIAERLTRVPLAPPEIAGVLNLRGRIVTLIDMRRRLGLGRRATAARAWRSASSARGESYGLLIDAIGEVLKLADASREPNPVNLDRAAGARCRPACTGSKANCSWCSTSIACSTSAARRCAA